MKEDNNVANTTDRVQLSIIIATYNCEQHIRECLESIISQTYKALEIIIIDGQSTDNTLNIIKSFQLPNLTLQSEKDDGIYDALNKGIQLAKGNWMYFLGADDRLLKGFSSLASKLKDDHTVYYGNSEPLNLLLSGPFSNYRLAKYCMNHQSIIYPVSVFKKHKYNLKYKVLADYDLNLKVWGDKKFIKEHTDITIAHYCMDGFSSQNRDLAFIKDRSKLIRKSMGWITYLRFAYSLYKRKKKPGAIEM